jgi:hypothetical protein
MHVFVLGLFRELLLSRLQSVERYYGRWMIIGKDLEGCAHGLIGVVYWHLPRGTEKTHGISHSG